MCLHSSRPAGMDCHTWSNQSLRALNFSLFLIGQMSQWLHRRNKKMSTVYICNYPEQSGSKGELVWKAKVEDTMGQVRIISHLGANTPESRWCDLHISVRVFQASFFKVLIFQQHIQFANPKCTRSLCCCCAASKMCLVSLSQDRPIFNKTCTTLWHSNMIQISNHLNYFI